MTGYTEGPWVIVPGDEWTLSVATIEPKTDEMDGVNYWTVASCNVRRHEARANLALIAAAPDLLEALEDMCAEFRALDLPYGSDAYCNANSLINKVRARGEA